MAIVVPLAAGCSTDELAEDGAAVARHECVSTGEATRQDLEGEAVWARFCPGPVGQTAPAETPSDALATHLDLVDRLELVQDDASGACHDGLSSTYRVQIGYADGQVAEISGATEPSCHGDLLGSSVQGPDGLGVYGAVMAAFGQQYADEFDAAEPETPLACPADPRKPGSVDVDGPSADLETGYQLGRREPMLMPLAAVRGIVCTWEFEQDEPTVRELSTEDAERVRIGMHAILFGTVDCAGSPDPTYTAVVEDKTGTRRAVTIIDSECSTVIRSERGFGVGFEWLDR